MKPFVFLLLSSFFMGALSGAYIYFASRYEDPLVSFLSRDSAAAFEITADAYGGCQMAGECSSYHIAEDGMYIYLVTSRTSDGERSVGTLTERELQNLKKRISQTNLPAVADSEFTGTCPAAFDGAAYRYDLIVEGKRYTIDTCAQDVNGITLFKLLEDFFVELSR